MKQAMLIVGAMVLAATPAAARSGNDFIKGCHGAIEKDRASANDAFEQGVCMGSVATLIQLSQSINVCVPRGVTNYQAIRVVTKFLDDNPERLNEEFVGLAIDAMRKGWPCPR